MFGQPFGVVRMAFGPRIAISIFDFDFQMVSMFFSSDRHTMWGQPFGAAAALLGGVPLDHVNSEGVPVSAHTQITRSWVSHWFDQ